MPSPPPSSGAPVERVAAAPEPHLRWWEGVASPGPLGYAIAVALSLPVLGALGAVVEGLAYDGDDPGGAFLAIVLFGAVFAVGLAPPGVLVVHLVTLRIRAQWAHVVVTGLVGLAAGLLVPLVPGVRRRRAARAERRRGPGADFGPTGHPG